jgi:hypothetical protein
MANRSWRGCIFTVVRAKGVSFAGIFVALTLSCMAVSAQAAMGLEPGVHPDPGSPAAKEYALPLNQARGAGGGGGHTTSSSAALFGAGIKPPGAGGSGRARSSAVNTPHGARHGVSSSDPKAPVPAIVLRAARSEPSSSGNGSLLTLLGGGVIILVLGGFGGTLMRRGHRPSAST